jgi:hypothetical protein
MFIKLFAMLKAFFQDRPVGQKLSKAGKAVKRPRNLFQYFGSLVVLGLLFVMDPDGGLIQDLEWGATTVASVLLILKSALGIVLIHWSGKLLFDYIDRQDIYNKVMNDPTNSTGAGLFVVATSLYAVAFALVIQKAF